MAQDIVGGLFGIQQQPDYYSQDQRAAIDLANLNNPRAMGRYFGAMIGAPLGRTVAQGVGGLLGVQDPRLQQAATIREAQQQGFDVTTPEGLQQLAQFFVQKGQPGLASQVAQQMQQLQQTTLTNAKTQEDLQRGQEYRAKVAELNADPNATEEDYIRLQRQYTSPEAGITASINLMSKREQAQAKQEQKNLVDAEKQRQAADLAFNRANVIVTTAQEALNMVNGRTAGPLGQQLRSIGGTGAADLESKLTTIKSLLAVNELQKIREASKTGGALGNVSNKDIDLLQSTVANLDQKQSPEQLRNSIQKVFTLYNKILVDAGLASGQAVPTTEQPTAPAKIDTTGWSVVTK